jgi:hypothetical protein
VVIYQISGSQAGVEDVKDEDDDADVDDDDADDDDADGEDWEE